jgi:hypothetical protein
MTISQPEAFFPRIVKNAPGDKRYAMAENQSVPWRLFVKKFVGQF